MKFISYALSTLVLVTFSVSAFAQKYKTPADTGKLNAEYVKVQNNIADLTVKLSDAQSGLPAYKTKAVNAGNDAQTAAAASDTSSSKATSGNLQDSKDAKKSASDAYDKAKDSRSANNDVGKQNEKIRKLNDALKKQRQRLRDLDQMRAAIYAQIPGNVHP
jgi:chromosome segregation ATPase